MKIQVGTVLQLESNNYIIMSQIDQGGNATVWKAHVQGDSKLYAIKVLNNGINEDNEKIIRFAKECEFCKKTNHKHIVKVFDYVAKQGEAFCVMPYYSKNLRAKVGSNHYIVRFKTNDSFNEFKKYALELSHPYYVFEGDVEKVIRIRRGYHGIVELEPLDSFDVTNTLAKILGLRTDYSPLKSCTA